MIKKFIKDKGQVVNGAIIIGAVILSGVSWIGNYVLNSPAKAAEAVEIVKQNINDTNQRVSSLEAKTDNFEKWLTRIEAKLDKAISR